MELLAFCGHTCETGWSYDGSNGCFKILSAKRNWEDAKLECESIGATLGVPTVSAVTDVIVSKLVHQGVRKFSKRFCVQIDV